MIFQTFIFFKVPAVSCRGSIPFGYGSLKQMLPLSGFLLPLRWIHVRLVPTKTRGIAQDRKARCLREFPAFHGAAAGLWTACWQGALNLVGEGLGPSTVLFWIDDLGVSKNRGTPKWMVYNGKPYQNGWFGGTTIFGNTHLAQERLEPIKWNGLWMELRENSSG